MSVNLPMINEWLNNACDLSPRLYVPVRRLWEAWDRAGGKPFSRRAFATAVADCGFPVVTMGATKFFHGLALKNRGLLSFNPEKVAAILLWIDGFTDPDPDASIPLADLWASWTKHGYKNIISSPYYLVLQLEALGFTTGKRIIHGIRPRA